MPDAPKGPTLGTCQGYDAAQITAAISAALKADDMPAVAGLMKMLAVADPSAAAALVNVIEIANRLANWETTP